MIKREKNLWQGVDSSAQTALGTRDYATQSLAQEFSERGIDACELAAAADQKRAEMNEAWIPGVEIFSRRSASGRSNGRLRGCLRALQKVFTCIHPAFRKIRRQRTGCAVCLSMSQTIIPSVVTMTNSGT